MATLEHPPSAKAADSHSHTFNSSESMDLRALLRCSGFRIRNSKRADCARCGGKSRGTVSYNSEVAHCFRCGWAANTVTLARDLGVLPSKGCLFCG